MKRTRTAIAVYAKYVALPTKSMRARAMTAKRLER